MANKKTTKTTPKPKKKEATLSINASFDEVFNILAQPIKDSNKKEVKKLYELLNYLLSL